MSSPVGLVLIVEDEWLVRRDMAILRLNFEDG